MLRKVFLQTQFGKPHDWSPQYLSHFMKLAPYGWHLKVFTPNYVAQTEENIEFVWMTVERFDELIFERCGVRPGNFINAQGVPSKLVSDYYPAYGHIFQEYIDGFDFWGFTNWDMVYGRLDRFIPDSLLADYDIWSDDPQTINGIFTLFRNDERINNLFRQVPDWRHCFTVHEPCAFDEHRMTLAMRDCEARGEIRWGYPEHFPMHSYDRLPQHRPTPNLYMETDGALIERFDEPQAMPRGFYGREIMAFHFSRTKKWPLI